MRGKVFSSGQVWYSGRITPAYAGKRTGLICRCRLVRDHPRLCGEKLNGTNGAECVIGSPPPMRGKVTPTTRKRPVSRITPAYAGKSFAKLFDLLLRIRITPAYAGKSRVPASNRVDMEDHPRLCGEKFNVSFSMLSPPGSPPPMRGKELLHLILCSLVRITPAYAGKSRKAYRRNTCS